MNTAPSLVELQAAFSSFVLGKDAAVLPWVEGHGLDSVQRMQIYRHIVENTLSEALRTSYPVIALLVGDDFFGNAADQYMRKYPPETGNLQDYGARFSDFIAVMPEAASLPYLVDIARLEWARQQAYLAADAAAMHASDVAQQLQRMEGQRIRIVLHPSVQCVRSEHRIFDIWHYCMQSDHDALNLDDEGQSVLLWREGVQVVMQDVDASVAAFLSGVRQGMDVWHALQQNHLSEGIDISSLLPFLVANKMIVDITLANSAEVSQ